MLKLEKFDGVKTYMFPNGEMADPDRIRKDFPAVNTFTHVIEVSGDVCQAVMNLASLRQMNNIDDKLSDDEAIVAIQTIINTPPAAPLPSANERIAAALEYQNLKNM